MKAISEIRLANARALADKVGGTGSFAARIDREPTQASRFMGRSPTKNIGDRMARHIEECFGKPRGWLDTDHGHISDQPKHIMEVTPAPQLRGMAPLLSWVQAGAWEDIGSVTSDLSEVEYCPRPNGCSEHTFVLRVQGESMIEKYPPGVLIFVDPTVEPLSGDDVIVQCELHGGAEATFKRYIIEPGSGPVLKVLNRDWREQYMDLTPDCRIVGVVMAQMRMRGQ